jgi:hypothetical protein
VNSLARSSPDNIHPVFYRRQYIPAVLLTEYLLPAWDEPGMLEFSFVNLGRECEPRPEVTLPETSSEDSIPSCMCKGFVYPPVNL